MQLRCLHFQIKIIGDGVIAGNYVQKSECISVPVGVNGVADGYVLRGLAAAAEKHQNFVCYPRPNGF